MKTRNRCAFSLLVSAAVLLSGCGQKKKLIHNQTYPVSGKITYKGEPARYVIVHFEPIRGKGGAEARARTDSEGNFELNTYNNYGEKDGGVPGEYHVVIEEFEPNQGGRLPAGAKPIPVEGGEATAPDISEIKDAENHLKIDIP